jgi:hypothetical protein
LAREPFARKIHEPDLLGSLDLRQDAHVEFSTVNEFQLRVAQEGLHECPELVLGHVQDPVLTAGIVEPHLARLAEVYGSVLPQMEPLPGAFGLEDRQLVV